MSTGKAAVGGPWALVDCDGVPRTNASYEGKFLLYYFGFTYCPDICPTELVKIGKIMYELGNFLRLFFLFSSLTYPFDSLNLR